MKTAYLRHIKSSDQGTFGVFSCPDVGFSCFSLELPWRDNKPRISRIPNGEYIVSIRNSPKYGKIYHVTSVEGRSYILIHWGNYGGDKSKGYKTHTEGCILLGKSMGIIGNQRAILNSRITINVFMQLMNNETFKLIIS